jgi:integrase
MAARTVDAETHDAAKAMIRAAYNDGLVSAYTWKTWENFKKLLSGKRRRSNKRDRVLQIDEYLRLMEHLSSHLKPLIATALYIPGHVKASWYLRGAAILPLLVLPGIGSILKHEP